MRPVAVVPVCRSCALWLRDAEFGPHQRPVAEHDGERWRCERRPLDGEAATLAAADTVVSGEIQAEGPPPLGPGVATRRGSFST